MRKIILLSIVAIVASFNANSRKIGIQAGINHPNALFKQKTGSSVTSYNTLLMNGTNVGIVGSFNFLKPFELNSAILYSHKGFCRSRCLSNSICLLRTHNIEIPLNFQCRLKLPIVTPFIQAGPYWSYILGGYTYSIGVYHENLKFSGNGQYVKRNDFGFNFGAGFDLFRFRFTTNYGLGLTNIAATHNVPGWTIRNKVFAISIAYFFKIIR